MTPRLLLPCAVLVVTLTAAGAWAGEDARPQPGTPGYVARDAQNIAAAYGRQTAADGQFRDPAYGLALARQIGTLEAAQLAEEAADPTRPVVTPGSVFPGWNMGNPLREGWEGHRGLRTRVSWTNRYGALVRGDVFAPMPGALDPYTGRPLRPPYPGVVVTTGSVQGSERMYWWLAEDLAERGYLVLTYDVQGQGTSETFPHTGPQADLPWCDPSAKAPPGETGPCPGVPAQQASNFVYGTQDATSFFLSTPSRPWRNPHAGSARVDRYNPFWRLFDRSPDRRTATPGRTTRLAIVGHSLGAFAVSSVQGTDPRVEAVVALDKLSSGPGGYPGVPPARPVVPALAVQSEYGFWVSPYFANHGSSLSPQPGPPDQAPDPQREKKTGYDAWVKAGVDSMLIVPRASTHLEYTDIPYVLPASRYGQDLTSHYVQAWLGRYLRHDPRAEQDLAAGSFRYLEPRGQGQWRPVVLHRDPLLSFYFCTAWRWHRADGRLVRSPDLGCDR